MLGVLIGHTLSLMHAAVRRSSTPRNTGSELNHEIITNTLLPHEDPATRKHRRRAERMSPMESDNVGVLSSASIWSADIHRRVCEWEVRLSDVALAVVAIS
jgi:hypothetical protein